MTFYPTMCYDVCPENAYLSVILTKLIGSRFRIQGSKVATALNGAFLKKSSRISLNP